MPHISPSNAAPGGVLGPGPSAASSAASATADTITTNSSASVQRQAPATRPWILPALLLGAVAGAALQLQQPVLWPVAAYAVLLVAACGAAAVAVVAAAVGRRTAPARTGVHAGAPAFAAAAGALALFALGGLRSADYLAQALQPALEGRDLRVTGMVAAMPQRNEAGTRLRLDIESATWQGAAVQLPPRIEVAWYGGAFRDAAGTADLQRPPPSVRAGERWEMTVRLKAPHGLRNPHGFDYELWMWEQGVQATGSVRAGPRDDAPVLRATTWQHPVERARQSVRDAILERLVRGTMAATTRPVRAPRAWWPRSSRATSGPSTGPIGTCFAPPVWRT